MKVNRRSFIAALPLPVVVTKFKLEKILDTDRTRFKIKFQTPFESTLGGFFFTSDTKDGGGVSASCELHDVSRRVLLATQKIDFVDCAFACEELKLLWLNSHWKLEKDTWYEVEISASETIKSCGLIGRELNGWGWSLAPFIGELHERT
ncbi:MAG: hypothetical protein ACXABY_19025 [Candidatus Thorarchaeota archaeon]